VGVFGPGAAGYDITFDPDAGIFGSLDPLTDGQGNGGFIHYDEGSWTLFRDGGELATGDEPEIYEAALPPGEARYELTHTVRRSLPVSTEVTTSLAWDSANVPADTDQVPVSVVRFTPRLALDSSAEAGRKMRVPVTVEGAGAGRNLASLTVRVSYDSGKTWRRTPVRHGAVKVRNPKAGGTVSFQAELTDRDGNTTKQSIIDAYRTE
jgi:hypothetical protein